MAFTSERNNEALSQINVTPLVDVMLVLLVIFMVTAPILHQGVDVNLPMTGDFGAEYRDMHDHGRIDERALIVNNLTTRKADLVNRYIVFAVMHELLHALGAKHHNWQWTLRHLGNSPADIAFQDDSAAGGSTRCPMVYWDNTNHRDLRLLFYDSRWNPADGPASGGEWALCQEHHLFMGLRKR